MVQVNLRIRESLRLRIEAAAKDNQNSLNDELVGRLEKSFDNEDLRSQVKVRDEMLNAMARKQQREGDVIAGWIETKMRDRGVDEKAAKELAETIRAYMGGRST
jgi:predicted secreted protein